MTNTEKLYLNAGACLLFVSFELLIGASIPFAALMGLFLALTIATIQQLGGVGTLFGLCMVAYAAQHIVMSQIFKAKAGELPESRLVVPLLTMMAYCVAGVSFLVGAWLSNRICPRKGRSCFSIICDPNLLSRMAIAATLFSWMRALVGQTGVTESGGMTTGGVYGIFGQMAAVDSLAVVCATACIVVSSNRQRFVGGLSLLSFALPLMVGVVGGHRAALLFPFFTACLSAWAFGYRFKIRHVAWTVVGMWVFVFILSPAALAVRNTARTGNFITNLNESIRGLSEQTSNTASGTRYAPPNVFYPADVYATHYLDSYDYESSTLTERFSLIKATDAIVDVTLKEGPSEMTTITPAFLMALPSFLLPDKPKLGTSNLLAHRVPGWVAKEDFVTQITFGIPADAFSSYAWYGVLLIPGLLLFGWVVVQRLVTPVEFKNNVYALALAPNIVMYFAAGTIQSTFVNTVQVTFIQALGFVIVRTLAAAGDTSYLHPQKRHRATARVAEGA